MQKIKTKATQNENTRLKSLGLCPFGQPEACNIEAPIKMGLPVWKLEVRFTSGVLDHRFELATCSFSSSVGTPANAARNVSFSRHNSRTIRGAQPASSCIIKMPPSFGLLDAISQEDSSIGLDCEPPGV